MTQKIVIGGQRGGNKQVKWNLPRMEVTLPTPEELARMAATATRDDLEGKLTSGRDALGKEHRLSPATIARRRKAGQGMTPFYATGTLARGFAASARGHVGTVEAPADRLEAVERLEIMDRPAMALDSDVLEAVLGIVMNGALK
jgi:hypothetical protein